MRALDDLVTSGKVRYIGFSDVPAWKVSQAQVIAHFRNWAPLIAIQIEYSLLVERTVEGELVPMALELGLGITPWSPLKSGILSGKYTRENAGAVESVRTAFVGGPTEEAYAIIDQLKVIADAHATNVAAVALAWVQSRPGVTSTIIGARRMDQFDANVAALDVTLSPEQIASLDALSTPKLNFPADMNTRFSPHLAHSGATVNGEATVTLPFQPTADSVVY